METQYLAENTNPITLVDVVMPQHRELRMPSYQSDTSRAMLSLGEARFTRSNNQSARGLGLRDVSQKNWSRGCQRACVSFFRSAPLPIWQRVAAPNLTKLSILTRQWLRQSLSSTANTATDFALGGGRYTSEPAPYIAQIGGVSC